MESKDEHNKRSADSSERVSQYQFGTNGYFGPQLKNLSNALKTFGQQLELSSEILKNAAPSELEFSMQPGETKKSNKYWFLEFLIKKINLYPDPCQESILEEIPQQEIAMDLSATILDVADSLKLILRNWSEIEKSLSQQSLPSLISDDIAENDVTRS